MLLALGESLKGTVFNIIPLVLFLTPCCSSTAQLFACCLHLPSDFSVHFSVLYFYFRACVLLLQLLSLIAQIKNFVCDRRLNLHPLSLKDPFSCCEQPFFLTVPKGVYITVKNANFPPTLTCNTSAVLGSFTFENRMRELFVKCLVFCFNLIFVR